MMPLQAYDSPDGEGIVTPPEVESGIDVFCRECGGRMRVRRSYMRDGGVVVIRHFTHLSDPGSGVSGGSCAGGGEGDLHLRAKAMVVETLAQFYPDGTAESERPFELPAFFDQETRIADAVVTFDEPKPLLGSGVVVEVQDKHKDKNVRTTTRAYLSQGYSVCWLSVDDFGKYSIKYGRDGFAALVRNKHSDSESVFEADLTSDGRVPRKEMYPLVATSWPHGVDVARDTRPRVETGWCYPAYETNDHGCLELRAESGVLGGESAAIGEMKVNYLLGKWLGEERMAMIVGGVDRNLAPLDRSHREDYFEITSPMFETFSGIKTAIFVELRDIILMNHISASGMILDGQGERLGSRLWYSAVVEGIDYYIPRSTMYSLFLAGELESRVLELPIEVDLDDEPTTPTGEVPFTEWIASERAGEEVREILKQSFERGRGDIPSSESEKTAIKGKVVRIVQYNTGAPQPESMPEHAIVSKATQSGTSVGAAQWAIRHLLATGMLEKAEFKRYRVAKDYDGLFE